MAVRAQTFEDSLQTLIDEVARFAGRQSLKEGDPKSAKGVLRVEREPSVKRVIRAYWTGFEVNIPTECIGLHLEVADPTVHWTECYLTPQYRNWVLAFHERVDGEVQLAHYRDYAIASEALRGFVDIASWYTLVPTDLTWADVVLQTGEGVHFDEHLQTIAGGATSTAIQESLKKSTILWL